MFRLKAFKIEGDGNPCCHYLWSIFCCCSFTKPCPTFVTPWTAACQTSLSFTISWSLLKFLSIYSVMCSNDLILCCPLLLLPSIFPSIRIFSNESGRQSIGTSFSASVLPMIIHGWFLLGFIGLISLLSRGLWRVFSSTTVQNHQLFGAQPSVWSRSQHPYMTTVNTIVLIIWTFISKVCHSFSSKEQSSFNFMAAVPICGILEPKKIKSATVSASTCHEVIGSDAMILVFWMLNFKPTISLFSFTSSRGSLVPLCFLP